MVLFVMTGSRSMAMTMVVVMSTVSMRIVPVTMTMTVTVVGGDNGNLEIVPRHVGEDPVLDVAPQVSLLGKRVSVLLRVHSPSTHKL